MLNSSSVDQIEAFVLGVTEAIELFYILKVQLTQICFPLMKSSRFSNCFSEQIITIDKILAFLQAYKVVIPVPHGRA